MYTQVKPFNQAQGGTTPNLCLANVTKGYGIPNKYGSAWQAWQNTEQHPDRNVPTGIDVPLYYSYTATLDGVNANYGHINVRLADGRVWSDGNIYASIDAYLANHTPKFVGWGESVNGVAVIKQGDEDMPITKEMEMSEAYKATGSYPGKDYNYPYVGGSDYNGMLSFWQSQMTLITAADEKRVAEGATGIKDVIGKDYNSLYVGKPAVSHYSKMTDFWNSQPKAADSDVKTLAPGKYKVN